MRWPRVTENPHIHGVLSRTLRHAVITLALAAMLLPTGCVRRRLAVRSNPPGALVFVDNQQIGTTPCSVDFTYYGTREIRLVKPGFETLTVNQPIPMPWYQIPPIDFVSENLAPNKIEDHRTVSFNLEPQVIVPTEQLLDRANQLRQDTLAGAAVPPAVVIPSGAIPTGPPPGTYPPAGIPMTSPTTAPTADPFGAPPGFTPTPTYSPSPSATPTPLPPVTQVSPPATFSPPSLPPATAAPPTYAPNGLPPTGAPNTSVPPYSVPSTTAPTTSPSPAPFSPPALPAGPPSTGPQQVGPPLVSPPLR